MVKFCGIGASRTVHTIRTAYWYDVHACLIPRTSISTIFPVEWIPTQIFWIVTPVCICPATTIRNIDWSIAYPVKRGYIFISLNYIQNANGMVVTGYEDYNSKDCAKHVCASLILPTWWTCMKPFWIVTPVKDLSKSSQTCRWLILKAFIDALI